MKTTKCQICGIEMDNRSGARKYCSKCRKIRDDQLQKERSIRRSNNLNNK